MKPLYWVIFAILLLLCVVFVVLAGKSAVNREKRMRDFYKKANRQKEIYEKYKALPLSEQLDAPADEVIEALAIGVQAEVEKESDPDSAFLLLPAYRRHAYAAYYFFTDADEGLSVFFRRNGEPVLATAVELLGKTAPPELFAPIRSTYDMLDDNNETVSVDEDRLKEWDEVFRRADRDALREKVKQYILGEGLHGSGQETENR